MILCPVDPGGVFGCWAGLTGGIKMMDYFVLYTSRSRVRLSNPSSTFPLWEFILLYSHRMVILLLYGWSVVGRPPGFCLILLSFLSTWLTCPG